MNVLLMRMSEGERRDFVIVSLHRLITLHNKNFHELTFLKKELALFYPEISTRNDSYTKISEIINKNEIKVV